MKASAWIKSGILAMVLTIGGLAQAASATFNVEDEVASKRYMASTVTLDSAGTISGVTTLTNKNRLLGFTGGVFVVALDENNEALYTTEIRTYGVNACFFKKSRTRTVSWTDQVPEEYLSQVASIAIMQVHSPTYRVWKWIYANKDLLVQNAQYIKSLFEGATFDLDEALDLLEDDIEATNS